MTNIFKISSPRTRVYEKHTHTFSDIVIVKIFDKNLVDAKKKKEISSR